MREKVQYFNVILRAIGDPQKRHDYLHGYRVYSYDTSDI